ncbi:hypothetical protein ACLOJK_006939 [Asimina triloba]
MLKHQAAAGSQMESLMATLQAADAFHQQRLTPDLQHSVSISGQQQGEQIRPSITIPIRWATQSDGETQLDGISCDPTWAASVLRQQQPELTSAPAVVRK